MRRLILLLIVLLVAASACVEEGDDTLQKQRTRSIHARAKTFERAEASAPIPTVENFPLRKALVEFTRRQDAVNHPWYVYILAETGNAIGYYVARTVPVNACNFLSSTEEVRDSGDGSGIILTAPSLDGIYYGGSGASSGCDSWFFFDSATNALVQIRGVNWYAADQPLRIDAEPIKVAKP